MRTTAIMNLKGGTGKTVTAINTAAILAQDYGRRVLLVDADSQENLTEFVSSAQTSDRIHLGGIADLLRGQGAAALATRMKNVKILPADETLMALDVSSTGTGKADPMALEEYLDKKATSFEHCIIDCPPAFSAAAMAALIAAAKVSPTRVARLDVIDKGLTDPRLRKAWTDGRLGETTAYEIARRGETAQKVLSDSEIDYLCRATTEEAAAIMDGAAEDTREVEEAQLPETEFSADSYLAKRAREDEEYREMLEHLAGRFLRELDEVRSRRDGIETLKKTFRHSGLYGSDVDYDGSPKGLTLTKKRKPAILRTWTEVYDLLSLIALRRAGQNVSGADTISNALEWKTGAPRDPGDYAARVGFGLKEDPRGCYTKVITWTGSYWSEGNNVPIRGGLTIFRWVKLPEV